MADYQVKVKAIADTSKFDVDLNKKLKVISQKTKMKLTADGSQPIKIIRVVETETGKLQKQVLTLNQQTKKWAVTAEESFSNVEKHTLSLGAKFVDITKKVAAFGLATSAIGLFTSAIGQAKDAVFEFDEALTEYKKVSDLSGDALNQYTQRLGELGESVARTRWNFLGEYRVNCGNTLRAFNTNLWWRHA